MKVRPRCHCCAQHKVLTLSLPKILILSSYKRPNSAITDNLKKNSRLKKMFNEPTTMLATWEWEPLQPQVPNNKDNLIIQKGGRSCFKVLHVFVWCLKHSLNTNTLLSSSLNEQMADLSKCWMIMAEDGCVSLLGDNMAFHSSACSSVPRLCVLPKGSVSLTGCLLDSLPLLFQPGYEYESFSTGEMQRRHGSLSESEWAAATWGMKESRGGNKSHYCGARVGRTPTL